MNGNESTIGANGTTGMLDQLVESSMVSGTLSAKGQAGVAGGNGTDQRLTLRDTYFQGLQYLHGLAGVEVNMTLALERLTSAANAGHAESMLELGRVYCNWRTDELPAAITWLTKVREGCSMGVLSFCLAHGMLTSSLLCHFVIYFLRHVIPTGRPP